METERRLIQICVLKGEVGGDKFGDNIGEQCESSEHKKPDRQFIYLASHSPEKSKFLKLERFLF